ncbi:MAG: hypothetical protein ACOYYS_18905 [Chloroflexota bacterium]
MQSSQPVPATQNAQKKTYQAPAIIHELDLETRAGSPFGAPEVDPLLPMPLPGGDRP